MMSPLHLLLQLSSRCVSNNLNASNDDHKRVLSIVWPSPLNLLCVSVQGWSAVTVGVCRGLMKANGSHTLSMKCLIPSCNRVSVVIKSGVYAKILTLNDELHCWCMMGRACNAECIPTYICFQPDRLVLQMQLISLRCVCVCVGEGGMVFY